MATGDDNKTIGRFIKKGSRVLEKVALTEFSFAEISETDVVGHDNPESSVILARYHSEIDLKAGVSNPQKFNEDLMQDNQKRPLLRPIDFTAAWVREQSRQKARVTKQSYEDDYIYDDVDSFGEEMGSHEHNTEQAAQTASTVVQTKQKPEDVKKPVDEQGNTPFQSLEVVGKAIRNLQTGDGKPMPEEEALEDTKAQVASANELATEDDFIPVEPTNEDPEKAAAEEYKQRLQDRELALHAAEQRAKESESRGFEAGFKVGEEKGILQARSRTDAIFAKVGELVEEFMHLKKEVLNNVQQNFYEICQAIAESLLKREFRIDPEAFATVVRRAIDEAVGQDSFKIRVHPDTFASLGTIKDQTVAAALVKDESVEPGDFKIESNLAVVEAEVGKIVRDLLDQADLELFEAEDKAG